jgi:hypothetical protein
LRSTRISPGLSTLLGLYERPLLAKFYEAQHRNLQIKQLKWKAAKLGFQVIQVPDPIHTRQLLEKTPRPKCHLSQPIQVDLGIAARTISTAGSETIPNYLEREPLRHKMSRNKRAEENGGPRCGLSILRPRNRLLTKRYKAPARVGGLAPLKSERSPDERSVLVPGGAIGVLPHLHSAPAGIPVPVVG